MPAIKSSANHVLVNIGDAQSHEVLHKRCDLLVKVVGKIEKTINGGNAMDTMAELFDDDGSDEKDEEGILNCKQGRQTIGVGGVVTPPEFWRGGFNPPDFERKKIYLLTYRTFFNRLA